MSVPVRTDADWSLLFEWRRTSELLGTSEVVVTWETDREPEGGWGLQRDGVYRLRYFGVWKKLGGEITVFEAASSPFTLARGAEERLRGRGGLGSLCAAFVGFWFVLKLRLFGNDEREGRIWAMFPP